jgi:pectinesterase
MRPLFLIGLLFSIHRVGFAAALPAPDLVVAADGSGNFKTIQAAVASLSPTNRERTVILIKDGVYREKIRVDASFVTLRGQSRSGTRIEFAQLNDDFTRDRDDLGRAVINLNGAHDFVLENLTVENTAGVIGPHAFTIYGTGDRTVIVNCDVLSHGADTLSLWLGERGRYYHANCTIRGSVDFVCPRGWCYATNCTFYEMKNTAAMWHDGSRDPDMKFVLRHCRFDGTNGWNLARHHRDAQFYFLDCTFSKTMSDRAPFRVIYPLNGAEPSEADTRRNRELDRSNLWGERSYFWNCHRDGGDYPWLTNNLSSATNSPSPDRINAAWTFADKWNPESSAGPAIRAVSRTDDGFAIEFNEAVTVKGKPRLKLKSGARVNYASGSGTDTLHFGPFSGKDSPESLEPNGGFIIACEAGVAPRSVLLSVPISFTPKN